jgi:hypothetical protein
MPNPGKNYKVVSGGYGSDDEIIIFSYEKNKGIL